VDGLQQSNAPTPATIMTPGGATACRDSDRQRRLLAVLEEAARRLRDGEAVDDASLTAKHPDLQPELGECLAALADVEQARSDAGAMPSDLSTALGRARSPDAGVGVDIPGYQVTGEARHGGQGVVYRAVQTSTGRDVAIKLLHHQRPNDPNEESRFHREVRVLAQLQHPNIVTIHDSGIAGDRRYFVMDYIDGLSLDAHVASEKLSVRDTLTLFAKVCEAVAAAHVRGVIHRDLKPANVLVSKDGEPHVLDFGLARLSSDTVTQATLWRSMTVTGQFVGSLPWASPEQAEGTSSGLDLRSDVYSLGVILYQLLTGEFPYPVVGRMREVLSNIQEMAPVRPRELRRDIDDEMETIVLRCLAKEPERRYETAGALARDIHRYLLGEPIAAKRDSTFYLLRKQIWRHRAAFAVGLAFVILLAVSSVVAWTLYGQARSRLWESYLSQARAQHYSGQIGQQLEAVATLAKAAAIRPTIELRDEAIACLALPEIRWVRLWRPSNFAAPDAGVGFDSGLQRYFLNGWPVGGISVRRVQDDCELVSLPGNSVAGITPEPEFSPDGRYLARATEEGCEIWDIDAARLKVTIPIKTRPVGGVFRFSPDGRRLAIVDRDGTIAFYEMATGQTTLFPTSDSRISGMEWSPQMDRFASWTTENGEVIVYDAQTGAVLHTLNHPKGVWSLAWNPTEERLATGCDDYNAYVWDAVTGRLIHTLRGHKNVPARVQFGAAGSVLATTAWDGTTRFWDPRSGEEILNVPVQVNKFAAHGSKFAYSTGDGGFSVGLAEFVPSEAFSTIVADDQKDADLSQELWLSSDGRLAATQGAAGIRLWNLAKRCYVGQAALERRGESAGFLPDRSGLVTADAENVLLWSLTEKGGTVRFANRTPIVLPMPRVVTDLWVTPDGKTMLLGGADGTLWAVDLADPSRRRVLGTHPGIAHLSASPDGRLLATGAWHGTDVRVWDLLKGELVHTISIPGTADTAFSLDGRWLATSESEHVLWDVRSWEAIARFPNPRYMNVAGTIAFSPDSELMAVRAGPDTIELINLHNLEPVAHLRCPAPITFRAMAFTPDGSQLIIPDDARGYLLHTWDLRVLRRQLAEIGLDW